MLLTFSKEKFKERILDGIKKHTIREDKHNRWKVGRRADMWLGSPRNTRAKVKPAKFAIGTIKHIGKFRIEYKKNKPTAYYNGEKLDAFDLEKLAINDGFDSVKDFLQWFNKDFTGFVLWFDNVQKI